MKVNITKSDLARSELKYLGFWITREGIKPLSKKVEAINNLTSPKNRRELRRFIGLVNYYRDVWPKRSETLAPLTAMTSKTTRWKWTKECEEAFQEMKRIVSREIILSFPDFSEEFHIHTDASNSQMGAVISQKEKPFAFFSRKLQPAQTRYTTTEKELLSIVETLKEFRNILLGQKIVIHTDHKNLIYKNFNSDRVMRQRLFIEEYSPDIRYIKGENNVVADALSRLSMEQEPREEAFFTLEEMSNMYCYAANKKDNKEDTSCPINYQLIGHEQSKDKKIRKLALTKPDSYALKEFKSAGKRFDLICHDDKIVIPSTLQQRIVDWYHNYLGHPGINRTEETISQHLWWPKMRDHITNSVATCKSCQRNKRRHKKYGHLPAKEAEAKPWDKLCVDLIGPYTINRKGAKSLICRCVTMIDPATGWFEIHQYDDTRSVTVANIVE